MKITTWEYEVARKNREVLNRFGAQGWEAYGTTVINGVVQILLKRPIGYFHTPERIAK